MLTESQVKVGVLELKQAEYMRSCLRKKEVELTLIHNSQSCNGGCNMNVELWAEAKDVEAISREFAEQRQKTMAGLEFDPHIINQVLDPSQENAICPACATSFASTLSECPDCGLGFSNLQ